MSRYVDKYKSKKGNDPLASAAAADFEALPNLSELMCGVRTSDNKAWEMPPHTCTIWIEGQIAKFALGAGDLFPKCFGTFPSLAEGLSGVEKALETDKCEWKPPKGSR